MKNIFRKNRSMTGLAALLLLGLFALCTFGVLLQGAGVYRRVAAAGGEAYEARTCARFFAAKARQAPSAAAVSLSDFGGGALVITEELEGQTCLTRIYCFEGWLMELFTVGEGEFAPADGEKLLPLESLSFRLEGQMLTVILPEETLQLYLRGQEVAHAF